MGGGWEIIHKQGVRAFLRQANLKHGNRESTTCPSFFLDRDVRHQLRLTFNNNPGQIENKFIYSKLYKDIENIRDKKSNEKMRKKSNIVIMGYTKDFPLQDSSIVSKFF